MYLTKLILELGIYNKTNKGSTSNSTGITYWLKYQSCTDE